MSPEGDWEFRKIRDAKQRGLKKVQQAFRKGKQTLRDKVPEKTQSKALEVMPEEVKILYVETLAAQSLVGGQADPTCCAAPGADTPWEPTSLSTEERATTVAVGDTVWELTLVRRARPCAL
jgi:hypothetical protein